jgi:hypothetical protein
MTPPTSQEPDSEPDPKGVSDSPPLLKIVNPDATPEEIAALVAVFAALGGGEESPKHPTSEWSAHHRKVRSTHLPGPGGWRSSGMPR